MKNNKDLNNLIKLSKEYLDYETDKIITWCGGCGNYAIQNALTRALVLEGYKRKDFLLCFDIGCNGNGSDKIESYTLHGLHGRVIPIATGCAIANPKMKVIPFLNKNDDKDAGRLYDILMESNFLFVPSKFDCTPIVFCEANAFGMPVITTNAGGIGSVITEALNGHMLSTDAGTQTYADIFSSYFDDPQKYQEIVKTSRESFEKTLNWDVWGESVNRVMLDLLKDEDVSSQQG